MEKNNDKNDPLWLLARKRIEFKYSCISYCIINAFLIGVWYFSYSSYFWPKWVMLGWGVGLLLQYLNAYKLSNFISTEKEYQKLKNKNN